MLFIITVCLTVGPGTIKTNDGGKNTKGEKFFHDWGDAKW
jgi:hypothetical protein